MSNNVQSNEFPLSGVARDGWSSETEATVTCSCGTVQVVVPIVAPGLVNTFLCNCHDCRKITASMFATNFTVDNSHLRYIRGEDNLTTWGNDKTPVSRTTMTNGFCKTCGTLIWRRSAGFPQHSYMRTGTVDDFKLHETKLKPEIEIFANGRVNWWHGVEGAKIVGGPLTGASM